MSAQDIKDVALRLIDAWNRSDFDAAEELVAPDFVNHNPPPIPGVGSGREGLLAAMKYMRQAFPEGRAEPVNVIAEGDLVTLHDKVSGKHDGDFMGIAPTGRPVRFDFIHIFRISNGVIAERWGLVDAMGLLQQLGAAPMPEPAKAQ